MSTDRRSRVDEPHVFALNALVRAWRAVGDEQRFVPWFDPDGPGVNARILVLMESPGPRTVAAGDLGFSTEDNDDPTAAALRSARVSAGMARDGYLRWNVVPWPTYDAAGHRRPPLVRDLEEARPALAALWAALPALQVVVAVGTPALQGVMRLMTIDETARVVPALGAPHPSPRNAHARAEAFNRLRVALERAQEIATS
ncbi:uracil-DNA glycosylase family protein [Aeromicrobium stalagmiti]|uniref:uracil-DNA glycosylase family protein n=1 Tax=Aeromicrobium stalagmiti TaxID=2738988 RepID=UPI001569DD82|nr:uracil-DNA glycosylase family protein [Aeromicrobium stalagmiti]NRQ49274.1 uracil-DNA glycosylase [Aeromicrobium stalagmiti]